MSEIYLYKWLLENAIPDITSKQIAIVWHYCTMISFNKKERVNKMLWTIAIILVVLWLLGFITSYTFGGFIHILLVLAVVVVVINLIRRR
ncbi:lmo0937 family membrane protein [Acetobacterium sp.]|uniref:lmo0937 family membrane protein n=1 Tax=Acetobacterium sp. TaxID=1872094 RepID=UPI003593B801